MGILIVTGHAQTFTVLHTFTGGDGFGPYGVIQDSRGDLYGVTGLFGTYGWGTVFKLNGSDQETVLHDFTGGVDGGESRSSLVRDAKGILYGTAQSFGSGGDGVVFSIDTSGKETVLHAFSGPPDGSEPVAGLVLGDGNDLYGTTEFGGKTNAADCPISCGTVFKLDKTGGEVVLYSFTGGTDGEFPEGALVQDADGSLYGTTSQGGDPTCQGGGGCGTIFKLDATGKKTILHTFTGGDGILPVAGLIRDTEGNFYGTAGFGGVGCQFGCGTVFKLDKTGKFTVLHRFHNSDGAGPFGGVVIDKSGNLYGATAGGGNQSCGSSGCGTLFRIRQGGQGDRSLQVRRRNDWLRSRGSSVAGREW